ncbi:MAG: hypothetical protein QOF98_2743, partial [Streptomyces sp.]|nr:hypothetical protein [Streptomyces sp.]
MDYWGERMRVMRKKSGMKSRGTARSGAASIATVLAVAAGLLTGTVATAVATPHTATASAANATVVAPERHDFGTDGIG